MNRIKEKPGTPRLAHVLPLSCGAIEPSPGHESLRVHGMENSRSTRKLRELAAGLPQFAADWLGAFLCFHASHDTRCMNVTIRGHSQYRMRLSAL